MNRPFLFISIAFVLGVLNTYYLELSIKVTVFFFIILFVLCIFNLIKKKSNNIIFLLLIFTLGGLLTSYYLNSSLLSVYIEEDIEINGRVDEIIWKDEEASKYLVKVDKIYYDHGTKKVGEKTVLRINGDKELELGDRITFKARLKEALANTNPKLYNYKLNLLSNKVYTTVNINDYDLINIDSRSKSLKYRLRIGFRNRIEDLFDTYLDESPSNLMKGIIMGKNSYLDEEAILKYREMGLAHILAVSGLHIGIISGFLIFLFSNLAIKKRINIFIVLGIVWFYGFLIGFPPSVLRASIMFSFLLFGQTLAKPYDSINILFLSFFILLAINPILIFNLGFQLSYMATFSILYFSPYINKKFYPYNNKLTYTLASLFAVHIGILPIQLYYFNSFSVVGIFSNLIITPILSFALVLGAIMLILSYTFSFLNIFLASILNFILLIQEYLIDILYTKGFGTIGFYSPNIYEFILYYLIVLIIFKIIDFHKLNYNIKKLMFLYILVFIIFNLGFNYFDNNIQIDFIDVGQGDCALIKTNKSAYLIDTGGNVFFDFDIGENIVLPYLKKHGISRLDGVFITHFHLDHCKSLPLLMENLDIKNIFISYENHSSEIYNYIKEGDVGVRILSEGDMICLGKDIILEVISPGIDYHKRAFSENDMSLTFYLSYYDKNILFTGDIEKEAEELLLKNLDKEVYLLKVPHHGSKTSSTEEFLNILRPKLAVISVGRNNVHHHPDKEVIQRYTDIATEVYRTDTMGMIRLNLKENNADIKAFLRERDVLDLLDERLFTGIIVVLYYLVLYIFIRIYFIRERELAKYEL